MSSMTTEFFRARISYSASDGELDYKLIQTVLEEIFKEHAVQNGGYRSIDLSPDVPADSINPKEIMDLFEDEKYLFGRISRQKANNAIIKRNYSTLKAENVLKGKEALDNGIEVFTFFIMDYEKGILSVVNTRGVPGTKAFETLCENYYPEYRLEFDNIPNKDGISILYSSNAPEISKFEFEIPAPNPEFLQRVLGLEENEFGDMIRESLYSTSIVLKPIPYHKLLSNRGKVRGVLDILFGKKNNYSKVVVRGNAENFGSRNFDLHAKYFTYPIEIKRYRTIQGKQVEYSLRELVEQYKHGLHMAYESNYDIINAIADR